ncbi:hypothetical protein JZ751_017159 [Albula glossodonta]|uniref:Uncharacterized protein n=1 Tax=Albula glossodonta TaxID=121402 RepID=A0A8T2NPK2_9TELE|nr:hypothetical protein JZ751_017159 [Albula glossodonta]
MGQTPSVSSFSTVISTKAKGKSAEAAAKRMKIRKVISDEPSGDRFDWNQEKSKELPKLEEKLLDISSAELVETSSRESETLEPKESFQGRAEIVQIPVSKSPSGDRCEPARLVVSGYADKNSVDSSLDAALGDLRASGLGRIDCTDLQLEGSDTAGNDHDRDACVRAMEKQTFGNTCNKQRMGDSEAKSPKHLEVPVGPDLLCPSEEKMRQNLLRLRLNAPEDSGVSDDSSADSRGRNSIDKIISSANTVISKPRVPTSPCPTKTFRPGERTHSCPVESEAKYATSNSLKQHEGVQRSVPASQSFPGTIPRLIVTRDPSPSRTEEPCIQEGGGPGVISVDIPMDEESPCSDSGCGGSPVPSLLLRKLSSSSSAGLSSASSFEESEDDFNGSDIEPNITTATLHSMLGSPDEVSADRTELDRDL